MKTPIFYPLSSRIRPNSEAAPWVVEEAKRLEEKLENYQNELEERKASESLRWDADQRGIKMQQEETGKDLVWPDRANLIAWLLKKIDTLTKGRKKTLPVHRVRK